MRMLFLSLTKKELKSRNISTTLHKLSVHI